jgi:putative peptide zinc metalloprotease protein
MDRLLALPAGKPPATVPLLRQELRLVEAANNADGSPAWLIQDPASNRFFRIDWLDFEILARWQSNIEAIVASVNRETTLEIDANNVLGLAGFLQRHHLLHAGNAMAVGKLIEEANSSKKSWLTWLVHHYLFFRIPLIRPQALLARWRRPLAWIFTPATAWLVMAASLLGIFLVARTWDTFTGTLLDQLTLAGAMSFAIALVFSKCVHELGHALTATHYGVRVAHMGVALLVLFPMPYTDTSESWKLSDPRQRMRIASAGIVAELALAGLATLAWSLAPEGAFRNALFFLATTSWVLTLAVNLSPFMRFDGYFILSDFLDFPNLHERAGALAQTWSRRFLLGWKDPWPEEFPRRKAFALILFAIVTWVYRLTVFVAIAWLVYYFFFKVLGILLFLVEILWFIVLPIWREWTVWLTRRNDIKPKRIVLASALLGGALLLGLLPWQTSVTGGAWIHALRQTVIYTPIPGKLVSSSPAGPVAQGASLFRLTSPDITLDAARSQVLADARGIELRGLSGQDDGEAQRAELQFQQQKFNAEVKLYQDELSRLDLSAPFAGKLLDIDDGLSPGAWVHPRQALGVLVDTRSWAADVLVEEAQIARVSLGDRVQLMSLRTGLQTFEGKVAAIDTAKLAALPHALLDAQNGGPIATLPGDKHLPTQALYKVRVTLAQQPDLASVTLAHAIIHTQAKAWLPTVFERALAVLVRESGF